MNALEEVTTLLGKELRWFKKKTCAHYNTKELPQEEAACRRRHAALVKKQASDGLPLPKLLQGAKCKVINLNTPKIHLLGHYQDMIAQYGTTDNYTTQHVSEPAFRQNG